MTKCPAGTPTRFFLFFYFLFLFFTKIYFRFRNLQEYTPAAPLPGGRDLVAPLWGDRGFCAKTFVKIFARRSLGPVARQRSAGPGRPAAGRPALPLLYKGWLVPHPSFASLKFQKPKKRGREGDRRSPAGFSSRRLQVTKIFLRFTNRLCCNYFC